MPDDVARGFAGVEIDLPGGPEVDRRTLAVTFLARGSAAAASAFVPGVRAVLLLSVLVAFYGEHAGATVGLTASYFGLALVATAGLGVSAVFAFSKHAARPLAAMEPELGRQFRASAAATAVLVVVTAAGGVVIPGIVSVDSALFTAYWFGYCLSVVVLPFTSTLNGVFQSRNRDGENLLLSISGAVIHVGLTALSASIGQDVLPTVVVAAVSGSAADVLALGYRLVFLAPDRSLGCRCAVEGVRLFLQQPLRTVSELPRMVTGAVDGLILMTVFTVAGTVATRASVEDGAIVVLIIAALRTLVIPLKQFGMVGGRLIAQQRTPGESRAGSLRLLVSISAGLLAASAVLLIVLRATTPLLAIVPWPLVCLMSAQLLLEPITGVAFAAQKILDRPSFGLRTLAVISFAGTIPVLILLSLMDAATAMTVWVTVFVARVLFFLLLLPRVGVFGRDVA